MAACVQVMRWRPRGGVSAGTGWPQPGCSLPAAAAQEPPGLSILLLVQLQVTSQWSPLPGPRDALWLAQPSFPSVPPRHVLHATPGLHQPAQPLLLGPHPLCRSVPQTLRHLQARGGLCSPSRSWGSCRCLGKLTGPFAMLLSSPDWVSGLAAFCLGGDLLPESQM